ncbi:MAG: hypothetical protein NTZ33_07225 [Bacteroidetes bacterium]|nr:hypothetical protein [Bacteroidota bacterium]
MQTKTKILIFISIITFLISCEKDNTFNNRKFDPPTALYEFPNDKLWKHRVNTIDAAKTALKEFNGIEIDVFFIDGINGFITGHDAPGDLNLETLFDSISDCSSHYYWIDFKNLSASNVIAAVEKMKQIINKYNLLNKLIVENGNADLLAYFKLANIFTSYWIPDVSGDLIDYFAEKKLIDELEITLSKYQFNAISAHYNMVSFMEKYLKKYNCHIWTNGLIGEQDKQKILNFTSKSNIKVILVDYESNFTK